MLVCKNCRSKQVFGIIPDALHLEVQMEGVGKITEKLLRDAGIWDESTTKRIRRMVVSEQVKYEDINLEDITQLVCKGCGFVGEADQFDNPNHCRCQNRTDTVVLCSKHLFVVCVRCFDRHMCNECARATCALNPANKKSGGYMKVFEDQDFEENQGFDDWQVEEIEESPAVPRFIPEEGLPDLGGQEQPRVMEYATEVDFSTTSGSATVSIDTPSVPTPTSLNNMISESRRRRRSQRAEEERAEREE